MVFQVSVTGVDELEGRQMTAGVQVHRRLFGHSEAEIVIPWHENGDYDSRAASQIGTSALSCSVDVTWRDNDLAEATPVFHGYVTQIEGVHSPASSAIFLGGLSNSARTDTLPRYRAFQEVTLLEIAQHIAKTEPLIRVQQTAQMAAIHVPLSLQYGETNFGYLSRLCRAWNVPMRVHDLTGNVLLGAEAKTPRDDFPDTDFGWSQIKFAGRLHTPPPFSGPDVGLTGLSEAARATRISYVSQISPLASVYADHRDGAALSDNTGWRSAHLDTSQRTLNLNGAVLGFSPGEAVMFDGLASLIHTVRITGDPHTGTASQEFSLRPLPVPLPPGSQKPHFPLRAVWARVIANQHDPKQQGRIQVKFEWEHLDPHPGHDRAWLHTLTPYGGGSGGTPSTRYSGFYSLPEVGERVLVEFLGDWDSEAVVVGSVRDAPVSPAYDPYHTKRWRTPSGNGIALTTQPEGDWVTIEARNRTVLQAVLDKNGESVVVRCGGSAIHLHDGESGQRVDVLSGGEMLVRAAGHLQIEGESVEIRARSSVSGLPGQLPASQKTIPRGHSGLAKGASGAQTPCVQAAMKAVPAEDRKHADVAVPAILAAAQKAGVTDSRQIAYMLATAEWENNFKSSAEVWDNSADQTSYGSRLGNQGASDGYKYRGRGYVQITGRDNYANWSQRLGIDLVQNPDEAEKPDVAAQIMAEGMRDGSFRGRTVHPLEHGSSVSQRQPYSLDTFIHGDEADYAGARQIINGDSHRPAGRGRMTPDHPQAKVKDYMAERAEAYAKALKGCGGSGSLGKKALNGASAARKK